MNAFADETLLILALLANQNTDDPFSIANRFHCLDNVSTLLRDRLHLLGCNAKLQGTRHRRLVFRLCQQSDNRLFVRGRYAFGFCFRNNDCIAVCRRTVHKDICILEIGKRLKYSAHTADDRDIFRAQIGIFFT